MAQPQIGTSGDDRLRGDDEDDTLFGRAGSDRLFGNAGNDLILGEDDDDFLYGQDDEDRLFGGAGKDFLSGGAGNDLLQGGDGDDTAFGGAGDDRLSGGAGDDVLDGGTGNDRLTGADGNDRLSGADGNDVVLGGAGSDRLSGADGNDRLFGESGNDVVLGGAGSDRLSGADGNDRLFGEDGNDVVLGGAGSDRLSGADGDDRLFGEDGNDVVAGGTGDDRITGADGNDQLSGDDGNDVLNGGSGINVLSGGTGNDALVGGNDGNILLGGTGSDLVLGGTGNDVALVNVATDGADQTNLGDGNDAVLFSGAAEIRLTFTSAEVGNGSINDGGVAASNQDGGLAVRAQAEDGSGNLTGPVGRYDDEGVTFTAAAGATFDVRDLVSGAQRGNLFNVVTLGTSGADTIAAGTIGSALNTYVNGGGGNDTITGADGNDFLVGGGGDDSLDGSAGNDSFIGGGGVDTITGGLGNDTAITDVSTAGADIVNLGDGDDTVNVSGASEVRLTFTSAEVGNGSANDGGVPASNQDGGLAVRVQAEDGSGNLTGPVGRYDDEGVTFRAAAGTTFDVRDLVSGAQRGNLFNVVTLGTNGANVIAAADAANTYVNAGAGDDLVNGADGDDFLVGGAGNDTLIGGAGQDSFLGGGGNDTIDSLDKPTNIFAGVIAPESDTVDAGDGDDEVTGGRLDKLNGGAGTDNLFLNFGFDGPNLDPAAVTLTLDGTGTGTANDGTSITNFEFVALTLTNRADTVNTGNVRASLDGQDGADTLTTGSADDVVFGGGGDDVLSTGGGNDTISGGAGIDTVDGGAGDDAYAIDLTADGADKVDLGTGNDTVTFGGFGTGQYRVTFTSAEVGNGNANDSGTMASQDGGLAVRIQREDGSDVPTGDIARFDDEGITFVAGTQGILFDVRDLVSGAARGDSFEGVVLGTSAADQLSFFPPFRSNQNFYYNAGMGDDTVTAGTGADFLVGGGGSDTLLGGAGDDRYIGGGGTDTITDTDGGIDQIAVFNVTTDGADQVDLGAEQDVFNVSATAPTNVRLTFTSADVGNGAALDGNNAANEDGGLAVRLQGETAGTPGGSLTRVEDEGITFVGGAGVTFDVRDLPTGTQRGEAFEVVVLGTDGNDTLNTTLAGRSYYTNGGAGDDTIGGGSGNDFLVGGAGVDSLFGSTGVDSLLGGAGADNFAFDTNDTGRQSTNTADTILAFAAGDRIFLKGTYAFAGSDAPDAGEYSITGSGSDFLLTYNSGGTLHDIIVTGADPTGGVVFY